MKPWLPATANNSKSRGATISAANAPWPVAFAVCWTIALALYFALRAKFAFYAAPVNLPEMIIFGFTAASVASSARDLYYLREDSREWTVFFHLLLVGVLLGKIFSGQVHGAYLVVAVILIPAVLATVYQFLVNPNVIAHFSAAELGGPIDDENDD